MRTVGILLALASSATVAGAAEPSRAPPQPAIDAQRIRAEPGHRLFDAQHARFCFNAAETREKILSRRLSEPFRLLRGAAGRVEGEALRAKLCRLNEDYVYDIAVLRRDGRLVHVYLNATSGQVVGAFNDR